MHLVCKHRGGNYYLFDDNKINAISFTIIVYNIVL